MGLHWKTLRLSVASKAHTGSLLNEVRAKDLEKLHTDNWSTVATPTKTSKSPHWNTACTKIYALAAAESLLNKVRARQTEDMFEIDWTATASSGPLAEKLTDKVQSNWFAIAIFGPFVF